MVEEIRQVEVLSDEDKQRLFGWGEDIFGVATLNLNWRPKDLHFLWYLDGEPISHVGVLKHVISIDGKPVTVGGVGGVVTVPKAQKRGFARQLMQHAAKFLKQEWQVNAGFLFCLPKLLSYYEALGWQNVQGPVMIEQRSGKIVSPFCVMVLPFGEESWPAGTVELQSLPW